MHLCDKAYGLSLSLLYLFTVWLVFFTLALGVYWGSNILDDIESPNSGVVAATQRLWRLF
ncbi:hypothetical protein [Microbulbifer variabilis]|uniref:Uncharacterized protein n=1 Tax=Microbulbifer variabilis TaxID=266805 RepID=A0ABY4VAL0_9GAMM|nr:hypothetical protein [Microbulbifer variabilis]USD21319.1 hypothetical protein MJO52_20005 [Microbulbifer variabilis]